MSDSAPQSRLQPPLPPPTNPPFQPRTTTRPAAPPASAATWTRSSAASRRCSSRTKSRSLRRRTGAHISAESRPMSAISRLSLTRPAAPQAKQPRRHPPWRRAHDVVQGPPRSPPARPAPPRVGGRPRLSPSRLRLRLPAPDRVGRGGGGALPGLPHLRRPLQEGVASPSQTSSREGDSHPPPLSSARRTSASSPRSRSRPRQPTRNGRDADYAIRQAPTRAEAAVESLRAGGDVQQFCRDLQMDARVLFWPVEEPRPSQFGLGQSPDSEAMYFLCT